MGGLKYPIKRIFDGQLLLPLAQAGDGLSRTNTAAVEMDPKFLLAPSCPGLGTRRLVLLANTQASCCFSTPLLGGFASCNLGTF